MKKVFAFLVAAALCASVSAAENVLKITGPADFTGSGAGRLKPVPGGIGFTVGTGFMEVVSKKRIPVDLAKKYLVTFEYRLAPGSEPGCGFYFAPINWTDNDKVITCDSQYITPGSETVLAAPVKKGDRIVRIKDGSKWIAKYGAIAFNAKKDLSDLPNLDVIRLTGLTKKANNIWEASLRTPVTRAYALGTAVRNHRDGGTYRYVGGYCKPQAQWKKAERIITGALRERLPNYEKSWRPGAATAGIIIFTGSGKGDVELRNISISEVK